MTWKSRLSIFDKINLGTISLDLLLLWIFTLAHRVQFGSADYADSLLAIPEVLLSFFTIFLLFLQFLLGLYFLIRRRWRQLILIALILLIGFVLWGIASFVVDPQTLVFSA